LIDAVAVTVPETERMGVSAFVQITRYVTLKDHAS